MGIDKHFCCKYEKRENNLKYAAADFMNRKYPGLVWDMKWDHVEFKNKRKAAEIKRISCVNCDWPDFVLLSPNYHHKGLVVEFKDCKNTVFKKNGQMRENKHLLAQTKTLNRLIDYCQTSINRTFRSIFSTTTRQ